MAGRLNFDEAILFAQVRLKVPDIELKQGKVEMTSVPTPKGKLERPWGDEGGFAIVYKFRTRTGQMRALRCFKSKMNPDTQYRYERMSDYFRQHAQGITAEFKYYDTGLLVEDPPQGKQNYSLLDMEWIEGKTLLDRIDDLCQQKDTGALGQLATQWVALLRAMRQVHIAHGDMAANNVMVRSDGRLVLVDYDGVYVPEFANLPSAVAGQLDYQHPDFFTGRQFDEWMDEFPALIIYISLLAVHLKPEIWPKYVNRAGLDTNLLFKHADFKDFQRPIWSDLAAIHDRRLREMVQILKQACQQTVDQVRFPFKLIDPDLEKKQALTRLEEAIYADLEEQIVKRWTPLLENYAPAQQYRPRVLLARQRLPALAALHNAFHQRNIQLIASSYDPVLDDCKSVTARERACLALARAFLQAYQADEDDPLLRASDAIVHSAHASDLAFTSQEQQRIDLARQRQPVLLRFRQALLSKQAQEIVQAYEPILDTGACLTSTEKEILHLARQFVSAYHADDDAALIQASSAIENFVYRDAFAFHPAEKRRIELAQERNAALARFLVALDTRNIQQMVQAYDSVLLESAKHVAQADRDRIALALAFSSAYHLEQKEQLIQAYDAIRTSLHAPLFLFTPEEQRRVEQAQRVIAALERFRQSLSTGNPCQIVAAYDPLLADPRLLNGRERAQWEKVRALVDAYHAHNDDELARVYDDIQNDSSLHQFFVFSPEQAQRLHLACQRRDALARLRVQIYQSPRYARPIVEAYDAALLDACQCITDQERQIVGAARQSLQTQKALLDLLAANETSSRAGQLLRDHDQQIFDLCQTDHLNQFHDFSEAQRASVRLAVDRVRLENALQVQSYELALRVAREIERTSRTVLVDYRLIQAKQRYIKLFEVHNLTASFQGDEIVATWQWPENDLIEWAELLWSPHAWLEHPNRTSAGTTSYRLNRTSYEQAGSFRFPVDQSPQISIQVYLTLYDYGDMQHPAWYYSHGTARVRVQRNP